MITKEIAILIYNCYVEIEQGKKMIEELQKRLNDKGELELKDSWGKSVGLELSIPTDSNSWTIRRLPFHLALDVIQEHIATQEKELVRLREVCRVLLA